MRAFPAQVLFLLSLQGGLVPTKTCLSLLLLLSDHSSKAHPHVGVCGTFEYLYVRQFQVLHRALRPDALFMMSDCYELSKRHATQRHVSVREYLCEYLLSVRQEIQQDLLKYAANICKYVCLHKPNLRGCQEAQTLTHTGTCLYVCCVLKYVFGRKAPRDAGCGRVATPTTVETYQSKPPLGDKPPCLRCLSHVESLL